MKQLSLADMQDLLLGCTILGTGGGGEMSDCLFSPSDAADA